MTGDPWINAAAIANRCAAQFVGIDNTIAAMFAAIACEFVVAAGAWR